MAIAKKPNRDHNENSEQSVDKAAEEFITEAGMTGKVEKTKHKRAKKVTVVMRFDPAILEKVDAAAERRGISRSAWFAFTVSRVIEHGEG